MPSTKPRRTKLLTVWLDPKELTALDQVAAKQDSDRSKLARAAIREKLARSGFVPSRGKEAA